MEILQSEESQLKVLHQYHEVDIPLPVWQMFACTEFVWSANQQLIDRWKQLWPHFKGIAISKSKAVVFCTSPQLVTEKTDKTMEQIIFKIGELFPKLSCVPMIEYNGYVNSVREFLEKGPPNVAAKYGSGRACKFEEWMEYSEEDVEDETGDEEVDFLKEIRVEEDTKWNKLMEDLNGKN